MAHGNLVGGTAYEIKGGRCLVGGTGYDIKKGRTLVGGTGYDVGFSSLITVSQESTNVNWSTIRDIHYMVINGVTYNRDNQITSGVLVEPGSVITFGVMGATLMFPQYEGQVDPGTVEINGSVVFSNLSIEIPEEYKWTVPSGISEIAIRPYMAMGGGHFYVTTS